MRFAAPEWLLGLLLIPLILMAVRRLRERRRRYALRFPALGSALAAAPRPARLATGLLLLALAVLTGALARPRVDYQQPVGDTAVLLVSDESGSMAAQDVSPARLSAAIHAADTLIGELPGSVSLGAIAFSTAVNATQAPTATHAAARAVIDGQVANGGTATGTALQLALTLLHGAGATHPPSAIVLLSDGSANLGPDPLQIAALARTEHIPIYTVALGTPEGVLVEPNGQTIPVPPDPQLMARIAAASGGRTFTAGSADQLGSIYTALGRHLGTVTRQREITNVVALGALALLLAGGLLAARRRLL